MGWFLPKLPGATMSHQKVVAISRGYQRFSHARHRRSSGFLVQIQSRQASLDQITHWLNAQPRETLLFRLLFSEYSRGLEIVRPSLLATLARTWQ